MNYDDVDLDICKTAKIQQQKYLSKCARIASKSNLTHKHGCIIVDKKSGEIISKGYNKNLKNHVNTHSLHAEIAALTSAKKSNLLSKVQPFSDSSFNSH